jgi:transcriptional regulator with XRE-family HTH domain
MATRWGRYFERQLKDPEMKELIEGELVNLRLGATIARIRRKRHLSQTQLAARARMSASKISAIENAPKNVELATLIRIAFALGYRFKPDFVPERTSKPGRLRRARAAT